MLQPVPFSRISEAMIMLYCLGPGHFGKVWTFLVKRYRCWSSSSCPSTSHQTPLSLPVRKHSTTPLAEYSLPEAILRFRQGFGRLIRTQSDRGVVAIFDRRIMSKRYGRLFTDSLPTCTTRIGPVGDLPHLAVKWLNI